MAMLMNRDVESMMVEKQDEKDVPILKEDQDRINRFARLSSKLELEKDKVSKMKTQLENCKDALQAVEEFGLMAEEGDTIKISVGEVFMNVEQEEGEAKINELTAEVESDLAKKEKECKDIEKEMAELKVILYAKFGKTINLEMDPDE
eukprot:m.129571 g.129571  ORF g.129571 m.129571 type:complete len:148 (+) comp14580_c0_seq1:71-514(+)